MPDRTETKISPSEAAGRLRCSRTQVSRFIAEGRLTLHRDKPDGHCRVWLIAEQVEALRLVWKRQRARPTGAKPVQRDRGEAAQRVFLLLSERKSLREIVILTGYDPGLVRELEEEWSTSFDDARAKKRAAEAAEESRRLQREHDKRERDAAWREQQVQIARLAAKGR